MNTADIDIDFMLKRLNLANARRTWRELVTRAEKEEWGFRDFLAVLVAEEVAQRQQTRVERLSRWAEFPFLKTIDDFNFTFQSTVKLSLLGSALSPDFVTEGRSVIFTGKPGRGKTHLAVAIAYRAIQNGFTALFVTAADLIDDLSAASRDSRLLDALTRYVSPNLLVIDEVGYLTYGTDAANMLYHVVNERHRRRRAMVFTSNKTPQAWGAVLHDPDLAQAIVDRVLERGRWLRLDGPSFRTKHLGLDDGVEADAGSQEVVRISGTGHPDFPEPTPCGLLCASAHLRCPPNRGNPTPAGAQRACASRWQRGSRRSVADGHGDGRNPAAICWKLRTKMVEAVSTEFAVHRSNIANVPRFASLQLPSELPSSAVGSTDADLRLGTPVRLPE